MIISVVLSELFNDFVVVANIALKASGVGVSFENNVILDCQSNLVIGI